MPPSILLWVPLLRRVVYMVPNQHGTFYYNVHFDNSNDNDNNDIHFLLEYVLWRCVHVRRAKERESAWYILPKGVRRWRTARRRCRRSSALHLHTSAQPITRLQPLPTLTPDGTHSHHNAHAYISFLASFLPFFLPSSLSFCPALLPHPFGGHAKPGRSR